MSMGRKQSVEHINVIERRGKYEHSEYGEVVVEDFHQMIESINMDGTVNERISVVFNKHPPQGPIYDGEEPEMRTEEYKQFIQSLNGRIE